jgi:2-polyprenyl-3-methyl-5-hydroxy-6-metoxy-1,4-benzoquinol methylase
VSAPPQEIYRQRDQPPGVPPLQLTGERTLPDVPAENYWYRRHLVVYEWIARQLAGGHVVDLACGEGYGAAELAHTAASVVGIEPNEEAYEHARRRYPQVSFRRDIAETFVEPCDAVVFLQTIEHVAEPTVVLDRIASQLRPGGAAYVSTPNVLTLAPPGAERSGNPWHVVEYRPEQFLALCESSFGTVALFGLFHARKLHLHELAIRHARWDDIHRRLGITKRFYDRFAPAISVRDFVLRPGAPGELERSLDLVAVCRP